MDNDEDEDDDNEEGEDCGEDKERYGYDGIIHCNMEITQLC